MTNLHLIDPFPFEVQLCGEYFSIINSPFKGSNSVAVMVPGRPDRALEGVEPVVIRAAPPPTNPETLKLCVVDLSRFVTHWARQLA
jgi:hypothetical protein